MPIGPGTHLGQYVVQDFLGEGAMGVVYRAYHPDLERVGAVKILHGLTVDPQSAARFRREAQAIAKLRHPNIVNVFDFGEYEGTPYMIVEFVEGGNLSARVRSGPLETDRALRYLTEIAEAIDYAHSRGVVHRDVKPANILMTNSDTPILADFGLVKMMESASIKSMTGVATGTPAYMAPEQVTGEAVGPAADRYSFAILAYQMLTGRIPFSDGGVLEVMYAQVHSAPPPPSSLNPALSPAVDAVLLKGLAKDPKLRWATCTEMVTALRSALATAPIRPTPAAAASQTVVMPPPMPAAPVRPAPPPMVGPPASSSSIAPPPADLPDIRYVPGRAAQVRGRNRRLPRVFAWIGAALGILIVLGMAGVLVYAALQPAVSVSPAQAHPGDQLLVTARHVPAGQDGQFQAFGTSQGFTATSAGDASVFFIVPDATAPGPYSVSLCWDGTCHASTMVTIVADATASPSPQASASPSPTALTTPISVSVSPRLGIVPGRTSVTVTATGLAPGAATITLAQGTTREFWDAVVAANGNLSKKIVLGTSQPWVRGGGFIRVCDVQYRCTATVDVTIS